MLSDVLSDAVHNIRYLQTEYSNIYGEKQPLRLTFSGGWTT